MTRSQGSHKPWREKNTTARSIAPSRPPFRTMVRGLADHSEQHTSAVGNRFMSRITKEWYNFKSPVTLAVRDRVNDVHTEKVLNAHARVDSSCPRSLETFERTCRRNTFSPTKQQKFREDLLLRRREFEVWQDEHRHWLADASEAAQQRHMLHEESVAALVGSPARSLLRSGGGAARPRSACDRAAPTANPSSSFAIPTAFKELLQEMGTPARAGSRGGGGGGRSRPASALADSPAAQAVRRHELAASRAPSPPSFGSALRVASERRRQQEADDRQEVAAQRRRHKMRGGRAASFAPSPLSSHSHGSSRSHSPADRGGGGYDDMSPYRNRHDHAGYDGYSQQQYSQGVEEEDDEDADPSRTVMAPHWKNSLLVAKRRSGQSKRSVHEALLHSPSNIQHRGTFHCPAAAAGTTSPVREAASPRGGGGENASIIPSQQQQSAAPTSAAIAPIVGPSAGTATVVASGGTTPPHHSSTSTAVLPPPALSTATTGSASAQRRGPLRDYNWKWE